MDAKSNEIKALPDLIDLLDVEGHTVSHDAMGCQKAIAQKLYIAKADYLLALKSNQGILHKRVETFFGSHQHIAHNKEQGKVITASDE